MTTSVKKSLGLIGILMLVGCSSTSELNQSANNHDKAGAYLDSIGQRDIAKEEYREAEKDREFSNKLVPILTEVFDILGGEG